jgi:hypothetical protein
LFTAKETRISCTWPILILRNQSLQQALHEDLTRIGGLHGHNIVEYVLQVKRLKHLEPYHLFRL